MAANSPNNTALNRGRSASLFTRWVIVSMTTGECRINSSNFAADCISDYLRIHEGTDNDTCLSARSRRPVFSDDIVFGIVVVGEGRIISRISGDTDHGVPRQLLIAAHLFADGILIWKKPPGQRVTDDDRVLI